MQTTLKLLVASTVLTAAIGVPAWSAMHTPVDASLRPLAALFEQRARALPLVLASNDDGYRHGSRRGHDDDGEDDGYRHGSRHGHDDGEDDDDGYSSAGNPAPAGTVAPPRNGLFGASTPKVRVK